MIIKRIREFVKRSEPKRQATRVADIVADAVGLAEIEARKRKIRILTEIRSRMPVIYVDPVLIEQVLVNLLKNAAEAMHDAKPNAVDPVIRVVVQRVDGGFVCISVVDQGPGVDEATAERLFEPFYSTKSDGMGMGLNICRSIIESHRGRLWVVNNVESDGHITGATFHCSLPIGESDSPSNGGPDAHSEQTRQQTVTGEL
jgi:signal transduction histidine kinase